MNDDTLPPSAERARALFGGLVEGRWEETCQQFTGDMRVRTDPGLLAHGWTRAAQAVGAFTGMGEPIASPVGEYTVVEVPMAFAKGQATGRVAYDHDGKVAGLALRCRRRHCLDPRRVRAFALRSPGAAELITLGRRH
jgi:hypothetical protein